MHATGITEASQSLRDQKQTSTSVICPGGATPQLYPMGAPWGPPVVTALEFSRKIPDFSWKNVAKPGLLINLANVHPKIMNKKVEI